MAGVKAGEAVRVPQRVVKATEQLEREGFESCTGNGGGDN